ncbi:MAG: hypothetical protein IKH04_13075 [Kiritimatiellae bacterium]|nr:hypothetical protein [Kiritimatiellia bacterium]
MTIDKTQFIANILSVVQSDGSIHPAEAAQCEEIRRHFGFSKTEWGNAEKLLRKPGFEVRPTGTFADNVVNLEMMLRVACADGDTSAAEADSITGFCAAVGVTQEQLDTLYQGVLAEVSAHPAHCPKCGAEVPVGAQFCPSCGCAVAAGEASVRVKFDIPAEGVAITFAESECAGFQDIYAQASATPGFQECARGKKTWYMATFPKRSAELLGFARKVTAIRNRELYIDGRKTEWAEALPYELVVCAEARDGAYDPVCHCFGKDDGDNDELNPVGCRLLGLEWGRYDYGGEWARMGQWQKTASGTSWRFDKERIRHHLLEKARSALMCPYFNPEAINRFLELLPDTVDPKHDPEWGYHHVYGGNHPGAVHVIVQKYENGFSFDDDFYSDGPFCRGFGFFREALKGIYGNQECLKPLFDETRHPGH